MSGRVWSLLPLLLEPQKNGDDWSKGKIRDLRNIACGATPRGMQSHADFMHEVGTLKHKAASWKDLFWENMATEDGS